MTKKLSRQRQWQLRKVAEGKCSVCGEPRDYESGGTTLLCPKHHLMALMQDRKLKASRKGKSVPVEPKHSLQQLVEMRDRRSKAKAENK